MSTLDKAESSRRNGAKSHGPVSPEDRERSSRNALKTGLYSKRIPVLSTEQQHELDALRKNTLIDSSLGSGVPPDSLRTLTSVTLFIGLMSASTRPTASIASI